MRVVTITLVTLCMLLAGCGDFFLDPGDGREGGAGGTAGTNGAGGDGGSGTAGTNGAGGDGGSGTAGTNGTGGDGGSGTAGAGGDPVLPGDCDNGPLGAPIANCRPDPLESTGDPYADCVSRINQLRWECQCLPPLQRWTEAEGCADQHSEYDSTRSAHSGFRDNICSPGGYGQNECPGWNSPEHIISGCLQAMWDEGPGEPFVEHGHYINMTNPRHSMVACGFYETPSGDVWSVQNFQ